LAPNISAEPGFVDRAGGDFRLLPGSPCIDAGRYPAAVAADLARVPCPLDGNGDGVPVLDIGAYEFDLRTVVPAEWFSRYGLDPNDPLVLQSDPDQDRATCYQEWAADTDPTSALSHFNIEAVIQPVPGVRFISSVNRLYTLEYRTDLYIAGGGTNSMWKLVPGQSNVPGNGGWFELRDTSAAAPRFYRVGVRAP
jgi:bifunctional DNA-binding transcriptional regulator/antitoxin component of YhaV-PrlF toxin-antitoxin module